MTPVAALSIALEVGRPGHDARRPSLSIAACEITSVTSLIPRLAVSGLGTRLG